MTRGLEVFGYYPNFQDNPLLTAKMKAEMNAHLLPENHPARPILDDIFSEGRVVRDEQSIRQAGFSIIDIRSRTSMVVARHPLVPGYIFKMYRDSVPNGREDMPGWECLILRCQNARKIREIINSRRLHYFTVPDKWLYILPLEANPIPKYHQPIILIATDMELVSPESTRFAWKTLAAPSHLDELAILFKEGYGTPALLENIPLTKHQKFAIIDTEHPKRKIKEKRVAKYFSKDMQRYWHHITH